MSAGDVHEIALELNGSAECLHLLCAWDEAIRGAEWPNVAAIADRCASVSDLAHQALHGDYEELRRFRLEYTAFPDLTAIRLLEHATGIETTLFAQVMSLSAPRFIDEWLPRYLSLNPELAARATRAGLA
jgi:hypothetical protein